jgi:hypothetical protein
MKGAKYAAFLDNRGEVLAVMIVDDGGNVVPDQKLTYDEEEQDLGKTMIGASLRTPNGCCWKVVNGRWKCRKRYCKD